MTKKSRTLILATLGGNDVQLQTADGPVRLSDPALHPAAEALGVRGGSYSERCRSILMSPDWSTLRQHIALPLVSPVILPLLTKGRGLTIALVRTRQQPAHTQDTWAAAELIQRYFSEFHAVTAENGHHWLQHPALTLESNPADYDAALLGARAISNMLAEQPDIDSIRIAPTGGTPAMSAMLMSVIGVGESVGVPVRWSYVPRGEKRARRLEAPGQVMLQRVSDSIRSHVAVGRFREAVAAAESFPFHMQRGDITAWLNAHAALLDADFALAASGFARVRIPDGLRGTRIPGDWKAYAQRLELARAVGNQRTAVAEEQLPLVEMALIRAEAFAHRGEATVALMAADAAVERLATYIVSRKLGKSESAWISLDSSGPQTRVSILDQVQELGGAFCDWFQTRARDVRVQRNQSHFAHGYGARVDEALVAEVLGEARMHLEREAGRPVRKLSDWLEAVGAFVDACLAEVIDPAP